MKNKNYYIFLLFGALLSFSNCTDIDPENFDTVSPDTFFTNQQNVQSILFRPFTHCRYYVENDRWRLEEYTSDQFAITTKGRHWFNGGENERFHYHQWTPDDGWIFDTWRTTLQGVSLAIDSRTDLQNIDYESVGLTEVDKDGHVSQLNALIGYFYMRGLGFFGGMPIFDSFEEENVPRNTAKETFEYAEDLFLTAIDQIPIKDDARLGEGRITKAVAVSFLAQLYFNAEATIGEDRFADCAKLCQEILDGKYGEYQLEPTWNGVHGFNNGDSQEILWSSPSEANFLEYRWFADLHYHYNARQFFDFDFGANNGAHLTPSRRPDSSLYSTTMKLGSPFEKFDDGDLRKNVYKYLGNGSYEGMFIFGPFLTPSGEPITGTEEYTDQPISMVDQVGRFSEVGPDKAYTDVDQLPSRMSEGEENTGIRFVKVPIPNNADEGLRWGADNPIIRLAEIYYMLAECNLRGGEKGAAATLINLVRARNFEGADPNPVTTENLDEYRMLDEWGIEFLGEGRRRTDLIRWNKFTTESWWDHEPSSEYLRRFPVPTRAISGNNNLEQNPGY